MEDVYWRRPNRTSRWLETEIRSFDPNEPRVLPRSAPSLTHVRHLDPTGFV